jgi:hypothetical protein
VNQGGSSHFSSENKLMFSAFASRKEKTNIQGTLVGKRLGALGGCQEQAGFERVASHQHVLG